MAQPEITSPFHFRLLFWQIRFFPDTLSMAVTAASRAEWITTVYFFIPPPSLPPGGRDMEGSQSCYQRFSKLEGVCAEYIQFVASQFDFTQPGEFPVSSSVCDKRCFLPRSASQGTTQEERSTDGFCLRWPKNCLCVPLAVPGHPGGLRSQLCGSHLSYPGQQGRS